MTKLGMLMCAFLALWTVDGFAIREADLKGHGDSFGLGGKRARDILFPGNDNKAVRELVLAHQRQVVFDFYQARLKQNQERMADAIIAWNALQDAKIEPKEPEIAGRLMYEYVRLLTEEQDFMEAYASGKNDIHDPKNQAFLRNMVMKFDVNDFIATYVTELANAWIANPKGKLLDVRAKAMDATLAKTAELKKRGSWSKPFIQSSAPFGPAIKKALDGYYDGTGAENRANAIIFADGFSRSYPKAPLYGDKTATNEQIQAKFEEMRKRAEKDRKDLNNSLLLDAMKRRQAAEKK